MNIKELIESQPTEAIASALCDKFGVELDNREKAMERMVQLIENLHSIDPVDSGGILLGIFYVSEAGECLKACLYKKEELVQACNLESEFSELESIESLEEKELKRLASARFFPESYSFMLGPWNMVLGYEVNVQNVKDVGEIALCTCVIDQMTFFGSDEKEVDAVREELDESMHQAEEICKLPETEQAKYYIPAEKVHAKLRDYIGVSEERTIDNKEEETRTIAKQIVENRLRTYQALKKYIFSRD